MSRIVISKKRGRTLTGYCHLKKKKKKYLAWPECTIHAIDPLYSSRRWSCCLRPATPSSGVQLALKTSRDAGKKKEDPYC